MVNGITGNQFRPMVDGVRVGVNGTCTISNCQSEPTHTVWHARSALHIGYCLTHAEERAPYWDGKPPVVLWEKVVDVEGESW